MTRPPTTSPAARTTSPAASADLTGLLAMADPAEAARAIAASPARLARARALLPALEAAVAPAGPDGVRRALQPLMAVFPQPERSDAEWALWWAAYVEDLGGFCPASLDQAVRLYRRRPAARFMPAPGELRALALTAQVPAISELGRVRAALRLADRRPAATPCQGDRR